MARRAFFALAVALSASLLSAQTVLSTGTYTGQNYATGITLPASAVVTFNGGSTFTGPGTLNSNSQLRWQQVGTLSGVSVTLATGAIIYLQGANNALTFDAASSVTGSLNLYSDGSTGIAITNNGAFVHNSGTASIYAATFTNNGSVDATAGTLYLNYPSASYHATNSGTVTADGSGTTVYLRGDFDNNGTMTAQNSGILRWDGNNTTANVGNVVLTGGGRAQFNGTLDNTAATLNAPTGGAFELLGGTITGGTIASGALTFTSSGGYLSGVSYTGDVSLAGSTYVRFTGGTDFTGTNLSLGSSAGLYWQQAGTLVGKALNFANGSYFYVVGAGNSATFDAATTATGNLSIYSDGSAGATIINNGSLQHTTGSGSIYADNFTNNGSVTASGGSTLYLNYPSSSYHATNTGSVTADGSGTTIYVRGDFDNNGTLTAQNSGILRWDGNNTTANLGSVVLAGGGRALFNGTLDNTAATLNAPTGGAFELLGGTITGGTIASGALTFTGSGGYLNGVSYTGDFNVPTNTYVRFTGGTDFTGTNFSLGANAGLYWQQVGTLAGKALTFASGSYLYVVGTNNSLTLDAATTATGNLSIYSDGAAGTTIINNGTLQHTGGSGSLYAVNFTNNGSVTASGGSTLYFNYPSTSYHATNTGTVTADGSGTTVYLRGDFDNNGTVTAQNSGILRWDGNNTTANLGNVVLTGGGRAVFNGTIDNTAATLNAPTGGTFELLNGVINGGTVASGALTFTSSGGYLSGVSYTGDFVLPANAYVRFNSGTDFTGTNLSLGAGAGIYWQQVGTLVGKALTFATGSYLYVAGTNNSLTLDAATTASGNLSIYSDGSAGTAIINNGTLQHTSGSASMYAANFTNNGSITATAGTLYLSYPSASYHGTNTGSITADGSGTTVYLRGDFDNDGTLTAQNSAILRWDGNNTTANLGSVVLTGSGRAVLNGTLDNSAATLTAPTGGTFELLGGTINNGTVNGNALSFTSSGGYLNGVSYTGDLVLPVSTYVRFTGGTDFTGANLSIGTSAGIYWQQAGTLAGKALTFNNGSYLYVTGGAASAVTLDAATTATGTISMYSDGTVGQAIVNNGSLQHTSGSGNIYAASFTNNGSITATAGTLYLSYPNASYHATNTGTITADGSGTSVYLRGDFDNNGTVVAQNGGILRWDGSTTTANLGNVTVASGGHAHLNATVDNTAATFTAPTGGGTFELLGGTIDGGTVNGDALTFTSSGGILSALQYVGNLVLPNSTSVSLSNGTTYSGSTVSVGSSSTLAWNETATLAANTVTMGSGGSYGSMYVSAGNVLTFDPSTTITGTFDIYGNAGATVDNQGIVNHTAGTSYLYGPQVTNSGTINSQAGTLYLGYYGSHAVSNIGAGVVNLAGGNVYLGSPTTNSGLLNVQTGTLYSYGNLNNVAGGIVMGSGTVTGAVTFGGGTLSPGNSIGTLTFASGDFTVTAATTLDIELSGSTADKIVFANAGTIDIGAGLMALSLTLLSAPAPGSTYTIMNISSGGTGINGYFSGLANSGDWLTANYAGTDYNFQVAYLNNAILLSVPEPSTYVLLGLGLAAGALTLRRKRR